MENNNLEPLEVNDDVNQPSEEVEERNSTSRREVLKTGLTSAAGLVLTAALADVAGGQDIKMESVDARKVRAANKAVQDIASLNSRAVLPSGKVMSRAEILSQLNLNPRTAPEAWLNVVACGVNASALNFKDANELVDKGVLDRRFLNTIRQ